MIQIGMGCKYMYLGTLCVYYRKSGIDYKHWRCLENDFINSGFKSLFV